ncbi:MASE1 domain-containing protein [Leptolyngbya sp. FACHB-36]|uniref:hybrid sensor histidine kinase/response regulator n=1 Tax=Leptolyngbya sp. FACHB-36 TaxID=2692808 RepID=UPI0016816FB0|nr:ATP-binding protein [Leptolyngbya sp. FACHB-36]MBD2020070.1 MASE1 domain-containing protein [Leptolyngbya sp. FACHB-36]
MTYRIPQGWKVLLPIGFIALIAAHLTAIVFRIQPTVSLWFPPSGVAITLAIWLGPVGVLLTGVVSTLMAPLWGISRGWQQLIGWSDATEPLITWLLYRYLLQRSPIPTSLNDAAFLIFSAPIAGCATSALVGSVMLAMLGRLPWEAISSSIPYWWLGNAIGTITIMPVALLLLTPVLQRRGWIKSDTEASPELASKGGADGSVRGFYFNLRIWGEISFLVALSVGTAALTVSQVTGREFVFQQYAFLNYIPIIWAATRFGAKGGTLVASLCVVSTLISYVLVHPDALTLSRFPVDSEVLHVHKLSLLVQCGVGLLLGTAVTQQAITQISLAVERVRLKEYQTRAELSDRLAQMNSALTASNSEKDSLLVQARSSRDEAEAANRLKDEFLAVLSHELRSPLNPILGWSKLLQTRKLGEARTAEALAAIERNAELQAQLIEDLLDISRIMRGKLALNPAPVNLATVVSAAIETVRMAADAKSVAIDVTLEPNAVWVSGDAARLQQVLWNLIANAVKFSSNGGRVEVALSRIDNSETVAPACAQITVADTGKGIHPEFLPHVFDYFRQEDGSTTRKFGGLGLGLAIARQIVELHGGSIQAASAGEEQGATFTVRLLLLTADHSNPPPNGLLAAPDLTDNLPLKGIRALVVDDDADARELLTFLLESSGAIVADAASAESALDAIEQFGPEILLSDIGMPHMDGYALMRIIRESGRSLPAIAITAYAGELDQQQALRAGFQRHVAKPIDGDAVIALVAELVGREET